MLVVLLAAESRLVRLAPSTPITRITPGRYALSTSGSRVKIERLGIFTLCKAYIMDTKNISSSEFQQRAGRYLDESGKAPVFITRYGRPARVLLDIDEYERLKSYDTRRALYPHELSDDLKAELANGYQGEDTPALG